MYSSDKSGFKEILTNFYKQISTSSNILKLAKIKIDGKKVKRVLYFGMGGSAIAGNLLYDILFDSCKVPIDVVRGYNSPAYCDEETLVIISSYSGNTEETISAAKEAIKGKPQIVAITSGGKIKELAEKHKWSLISIPSGLPPRQALGYIFFPLYLLLGKTGLVAKSQENLNQLASFAAEVACRNDSTCSDGHILSEELAKMVKGKIPMIYSAAPYFQTVSRRWQNQFHENSKSMAFSNVLPEMNHNEIVGWEQDTNVAKDLIVIFLEDEMVHPRVKVRIDLTKKIVKQKGVKIVDIYTQGKTLLEKIFYLIILGDWTTYYLALHYKKDPIQIKNIDYLKNELAKL
jgi:glucose/mannose-6-phosphate isomerase